MLAHEPLFPPRFRAFPSQGPDLSRQASGNGYHKPDEKHAERRDSDHVQSLAVADYEADKAPQEAEGREKRDEDPVGNRELWGREALPPACGYLSQAMGAGLSFNGHLSSAKWAVPGEWFRKRQSFVRQFSRYLSIAFMGISKLARTRGLLRYMRNGHL